jgi:DNA-binding NarL/FixJ family response regulator
MLRILLVDDQKLIRTALRSTLEAADMDVVAETASGDEAIAVASDLAPDVVVMDLGMPGTSGIEATRQLSTVAPLSRVLVLTGSIEQHDVLEAIMAGACGYLLKDAEPEDIVAAIRAAAAGESVISTRIAGRLLDRIRGGAAGPEPGAAIRAALTERELEVLKLVASGKENPEIAKELFISTKTVKNHMSSILAKLQLENRIQAAVHAVRSGIV